MAYEVVYASPGDFIVPRVPKFFRLSTEHRPLFPSCRPERCVVQAQPDYDSPAGRAKCGQCGASLVMKMLLSIG